VAAFADAVTEFCDHGTVHIFNNKILIHDINAVFESIQYRSRQYRFLIYHGKPLYCWAMWFGTSPFGLPTTLFELRRDKSTPQAGFNVPG
jgi:hypothetical protein